MPSLVYATKFVKEVCVQSPGNRNFLVLRNTSRYYILQSA